MAARPTIVQSEPAIDAGHPLQETSMQQAITVESFLAFLTYFGAGIAVLFIAATIVVW